MLNSRKSWVRATKARNGMADFGTYHHTTSDSSKKIRERVKLMFIGAFKSVPFKRNDRLRILDIGCGLGFLSCVSAEFYENARITGIDTFKDESLKDSSIHLARANAKILGFSDRIDFRTADLLKYVPDKSFDIFVSNLVFHNLEKRKRFKAYSRLASWSKTRSYVLIGDLFFSPEEEMTELSKLFRVIKGIKPDAAEFGHYSVLVMSKNSDLVSE